MKLEFHGHNMDVATYPFRFMRILSIAGTGGSEPSECFLTLEKIRNHDDQSWVREWANLAERTQRLAEEFPASRAGGNRAPGVSPGKRLLPGGHVFLSAKQLADV